MSTLTLVRHAQAHAFAEDSDRLTELGERQAGWLGQWWAGRGIRFDEVHCGTLTRQRRTAELAGLPELLLDPAWNEYDAPGILNVLAPRLAARDASFALLLETYRQRREADDVNRHFQPMFEAVLREWVLGTVGGPGVEPFAEFQARVRAGLDAIIGRPARGRRVLVVTSGGPIGAVAQYALQAPPEMAIQLNWRIRNCSISEFLFSNGRIALDAFNALPPFPGQAWITYR